MKNLVLTASVLAALALGAGCTTDDGGVVDASLTVVNRSDFAIEQLYLTDSSSRGWGGDLLWNDILLPGEELTLGVDCGFYDALLIDEDGVRCELYDLDLYFNDATWFIYNNTCEAFEAALKARQAKAAEAQGQTAPADAAK